MLLDVPALLLLDVPALLPPGLCSLSELCTPAGMSPVWPLSASGLSASVASLSELMVSLSESAGGSSISKCC